jgi:chorismate mutase
VRAEADAGAPHRTSGLRSVATQRFLTAFFLALVAACAAPPLANSEEVDRLLALMQERLRIAEGVARNKWSSGAPIEDPARESEIVEQVGGEAPRYGIDPAIARDFFRAQIEASKIVQRARFEEWRRGNQPRFSQVPDLGTEIRPALDALTPQLLAALGKALPALQSPGFETQLQARSAAIMNAGATNETARETAIAPLKRLARSRADA